MVLLLPKALTLAAACTLVVSSVLITNPAHALQFNADGTVKGGDVGPNSADPDDDIDFARMVRNGEAIQGGEEPDADKLKGMMDAMEQMDPDMLQGGGGGMGGLGSMMGGMDGMPARVNYKPVKSDIKYIICDTCKAMVKRVAFRADEFRKEVPKFKFTEEALGDKFESACHALSREGAWIKEYDMVETEDGKYIDLKRQSGPGECKEECKTIEAACEKIHAKAGHELIAQLYMGKMERPMLTDYVCTKLLKNVKGGCGKDRLIVPKSRVSGGDNFEGKGRSGRMMDEINHDMRDEHPEMMAPKHMIDEL